MSERILVLRGGALGDFILGLPALRALRSAHPRAQLELIAPGPVLSLSSTLVDDAVPFERADMASLFGDPDALREEIARRYSGLDLVVLWLADADGSLRRAFQRLGAHRVLWAPALPSERAKHATDHLVDSLHDLGVDASGPHRIPVIEPEPEAVSRMQALLRDRDLRRKGSLVAIHPGSGGRRKLWPADRFARVADRLVESGLAVALVEGPADEDAVRQVRAGMNRGPVDVIRDLSVRELAALLSLCDCYLGNDSGVTHLAAAVGTPTVALFGPTDPAVWGPRGRRVTVLRAPRGRLEEVGVDQVMDAVGRMVGGVEL